MLWRGPGSVLEPVDRAVAAHHQQEEPDLQLLPRAILPFQAASICIDCWTHSNRRLYIAHQLKDSAAKTSKSQNRRAEKEKQVKYNIYW